MKDFHRELIAHTLSHFSQALGNPQTLILKDPTITAECQVLAELAQGMKFVVSVRDPCDIIASRLRVDQKLQPAMSRSEILERGVAEFLSSYKSVMELKRREPKRLRIVCYEDFASNCDVPRLQDFLSVDDLDPDKIWLESEEIQIKHAIPDNAWNSSLYFQPISSRSIGSYSQVLTQPEICLIQTQCAELHASLIE